MSKCIVTGVAPLPAATRPITEQEKHMFETILPHYKEISEGTSESHPLKRHYNHLQRCLNTGMIGTVES